MSRVVLLESDPDDARRLWDGLAEAGYVVRTASTAVVALQIEKTWSPDAIVVGSCKRGESEQLLQILGSNPRNDRRVLRVLPAGSQPIDRTSSMKAGADAVVLEPFAAADLASQLRMLLMEDLSVANPASPTDPGTELLPPPSR